MIKPALSLLAFMACFGISRAQISISSANYNSVSLNETNLLQAIVSNSNQPMVAKATVTIKNSSGEIILEATSKNFTLSAGINNLNGVAIGFSSVVYGTSGKALYLKNNGLLSSGNYTYCMRIIPLGSTEDGDLYCEEFEAATDDFLTLITPYDKDIIDTQWPVLTWTHSEPFNTLAKNEYFKIILTEVNQNQTAEQAIFSNPAVYSQNFLNTHSIPYPQDAKMLEQGKNYAWQVQKISNNLIVNKTDVWQFSIAKPEPKESQKYAVLKDKHESGFYTCTNEILYFRFEEEYYGTKIWYQLKDDMGQVINLAVETDKDRGASDMLEKSTGINYYQLDIEKYHLKKGFYNLTVKNEKNQKFYLKFFVEK